MGSRILDFRQAEVEETPPEAVAPVEWSEAEDAPAPVSRTGDRVIAALIALLALAWLGAIGWQSWAGLRTGASLGAVLTMLALASGPLALLGVTYLILMRSSRAEAQGFARTSAALRGEARWLEEVIAGAAARLEENREALHAQTGAFMGIGEEAAARLKIVTDAMHGEVDTLSRQGHALRAAATAARADMSVLLSDLPKAEVQARKMAEDLRQAGMGAHENAAQLEARIASLAERGREADEIASGAATRLAAHLTRMESVSETAGARLEGAAGQMTSAVDAALSRAAEALEEARKGMEAQGAAMLAMLSQTQAALGQTGESAGREIGERVAVINGQVRELGTTLDGHAEASRALSAGLAAMMSNLHQQIVALSDQGEARTGALGDAIANLATHADRLNAALETGGGRADTLIQRSEALFTGLDANARELDENLPAAFERLDARAAKAKALLATLTPDAEALEMTALSAANRLAEIDASVTAQRTAIEGVLGTMDARIAANRSAVAELEASIRGAGEAAHALADGAGPQLIETLLRVRDTANQASERARESIERIAPEAAAALVDASDKAMTGVFQDRVQAQVAELTALAERAVSVAQVASERLTRQLMTIAETSGQIEARVSEHHEEGLSRRVSLLIESLNSTAIDVTKVLSNDVTDQAWAAYLKGDRGVFTRRAVRLLDNGEAREIARHYDADGDFREHVNRYVHDFEAILRSVLATRDGSPLAVTMLSSDMGKLYVALAQAIERLRT